jgi:hypothetical protein
MIVSYQTCSLGVVRLILCADRGMANGTQEKQIVQDPVKPKVHSADFYLYTTDDGRAMRSAVAEIQRRQQQFIGHHMKTN